MRLTHVRLLVDDFPHMFRFYRDVIGLHATFGDEHDVYADFEAGAIAIALFRRDLMAEAMGIQAAEDREGLARIALILSVEDVDAETARLESAGAEMVAEPADRPDWGLRAAHFRDPEGNVLEIYSPLP